MKIKNLAQEDMSGNSQVLFFKEYNTLTGQWIPKFETRYYENEKNLYAIEQVFALTGVDAKTRIYKAIKMLSKCLYTGPSFQDAMKARK